MNPSTALATVLLDELVRCGLTDVVLAPGSRSAPLAMAADADPRLRVHVRIDERSAGYLALGLGKGSLRPAAVVCTSGTAAANLHPPVVEASHAGVGLLVLTADRPPELRDTGANQTIDQIKLYGTSVRWFCEVGAPEAREGSVAYWRSLACRAWGSAVGLDPGPVHLNMAFREPLTPDESADWPESLDGRPEEAPWTAHSPPPAEREVPPLPDARRGLLVAGDGAGDPTPYVALAAQHGWPVLAEPTSGARHGTNAVSAYHYLLGAPGFAEAHRPDLVVTVGKPALSRPLLSLIETAADHVAVSPTPRWPDPTRSASRVLHPARPRTRPVGPPDPPARQHGQPPWLRSWLDADRKAREAIDQVLDAADEPSEPRAARDLAAAIPDGGLLFAGSSLPIRDLDRTMRPRAGVRILGNRGTSGIDGSVSTAAGAALAHGGPAFALLGDLALLHDQNGLLPGPSGTRPELTLVVINNDGGGIFSMLPQAGYPDSFERVFGTPHGAELGHVAAAAGIPYERLERATDLPGVLAGADTAPLSPRGPTRRAGHAKARGSAAGMRLVEVRTDRSAGAALRAELQRAVDEALCGFR